MNTTLITRLFALGLLLFTHSQLSAQDASPKPRIITEREVKVNWLKKFPQPRSLASDYHQQQRSYQELLANIKAGKYDYEASLKAYEWNIAEYTRVRDFQMADQIRKDLDLLVRHEEERKRTAAAEASAAASEASAAALQRLELHLRSIQFEIKND